jgi:ABC-type antimicrobial peptide transport system permease subunit
VWNFRVVGIIAQKMAHDPFWAMANPFSTSTIALNSRYYFFLDASPANGVLAANEAIRPKIAVLQATPSEGDFTNAFALFWRYPFDLARLDASDLPALSQQTSDVDNRVQDTLQRNVTDLVYSNVFGSLFTTLEFSSVEISFTQLTVTFLLLVTLALVLFLVSLMSDVLIERQNAVIATLRSRGATRRHIFGAFAIQGIILGVVALLVGPFLALLLVRGIAQNLLAPEYQSAVNVIAAHPFQAVLDVAEYAIIAVVVALLVLILAINRATRMDIVSFRRESSRPQHVPLWRRLYLDLIIAFLLLAGYGVYSYFWSFLTISSSRIDPVVYNLLTGLSFFTTPLLVAAILLLFLRLFPQILRLATYLVAKMRSAPAVLALAQMERTPRPAARMIVLLALAIASSCFLLTLIASKEQRNIDAATFSVEAADFSGSLPTSDASRSLNQLKAYYSTLPGVQSATLGYHDVIQLGSDHSLAGPGAITISAVDVDTYAHTVTWPTSYSSQPLSELTAQLALHRFDGIARNVVYALVDTATWQRLHLTQGIQFTLPADSSENSHINYIALARINYVPGVYDTPTLTGSGMGLIVDYQNYVAVKARVTGGTATALSPNRIWLRTNDDATSLARLRNILPDLNDRNQLIATIQNNPDYLSIIGVMYIGVGAAFVLALVGTLILSWLNASNRLTNFAVARALGMAPRQIAAVLLWEQSLVYILALFLGLSLGTMLTMFVAPTVGNLPIGSGLDLPFDIPAIQVVIPYLQLLLLLGVLMIICLVALLLMARIVSRPSLGQTLRLNED